MDGIQLGIHTSYFYLPNVDEKLARFLVNLSVEKGFIILFCFMIR